MGYVGPSDKQKVSRTNLKCQRSNVELNKNKLGLCNLSYFVVYFSFFNVKIVPLSSAVVSNSSNFHVFTSIPHPFNLELKTFGRGIHAPLERLKAPSVGGQRDG